MAPIERSFPAFVLVASVAVLGAALVSQYWGGLAPCELCLKERWPWVAAIAVAVVATTTGSRRASPRIALLLTAIFAIGSALAFYHVGVERHWFPGPAACTAPGLAADTIEALKAQLLHQMPVRCDEPAWSLWGISLAGWNLIASLGMGGICLAVFAQLRAPRRGAA
jgi:disulfide bond formation protein DsbB